MINIHDKTKCCGCSSCLQACPKQCIKFIIDEQGFEYPIVDRSSCINCNICVKVCPELNLKSSRKPKFCFASISKNHLVRQQSSSGGLFTLIAEKVLLNNGIVFGAAFNSDWGVEHICVDKIEDLYLLRGSKYVQSKIGNTYQRVISFLKQGRTVLFTGTSCQIAGLKQFLRVEYDNLLTVDLVCHGVPSPMLWKTYLEYITHKHTSTESLDTIEKISFRDKRKGWKRFSVSIVWKNGHRLNQVLTNNLYLDCFLKNLTLRPSCSQCIAKDGRSGSDISLADYWGISKISRRMDDDKGTSLVLVYTEKGQILIESLDAIVLETSYHDAFNCNRSIEESTVFNRRTNEFWKIYQHKGWIGVEALMKDLRPNVMLRIKNYIYRKLF